MYVDSRTIEAGAEIKADVCIIGAGAAGITIANELSGSSLSVALVESGGFDYDDDTQELMRGEIRRGVEDQLITSRMRYFGGTTNAWGGECLPLSAVDLEKRDAVPMSGWPIERSDLDPYYARAHEVLQIGSYDYDPQSISKKLDLALLPFDRSHIDTAISRHRPVRFGEDFREALKLSENVRVFLYGNLININRDPHNALVRNLSIKTLSGKAFTVHSRAYILAMGGVENARMLLLSRDVDTAGIGNGYDHVGRYFMEHLSFISGYLAAADASTIYRFYTEDHSGGDYDISAKISLSESLVRDLAIPNYRAVLTLSPNPSLASAREAARDVYADVRRREWPGELLDRIGKVVGGLVDYTGDWISGEDLIFYRLRSVTEQVPNPDSRVGLVEAKDALGLNRLYLDWRISEIDKLCVMEGTKAVALEAGRSGFGRVRMSFSKLEEVLPHGANGAHHHIGTTRMHDDPKLGVVNANCQVHGLGNLFIAGSSIFPTSGHANPTLTIVALSLRLTDHIKKKMVG